MWNNKKANREDSEEEKNKFKGWQNKKTLRGR